MVSDIFVYIFSILPGFNYSAFLFFAYLWFFIASVLLREIFLFRVLFVFFLDLHLFVFMVCWQHPLVLLKILSWLNSFLLVLIVISWLHSGIICMTFLIVSFFGYIILDWLLLLVVLLSFLVYLVLLGSTGRIVHVLGLPIVGTLLFVNVPH